VAQRVSAFILAVYFLFIMGFILANPGLQFEAWSYLFQGTPMRLFSFLALLSLMWHSWVGVWTVLTDYIKCKYLQWLLVILVMITLVLCLAWGIQILWSL
ncbi:MAG: succinate dehydrogenase, hydrophobic membrane anchor protein, partial [Gammaproteobacteria bacterium]